MLSGVCVWGGGGGGRVLEGEFLSSFLSFLLSYFLSLCLVRVSVSVSVRVCFVPVTSFCGQIKHFDWSRLVG